MELRKNLSPAYHANAVLIAVQGAIFSNLACITAEHIPSIEQDKTQSSSDSTPRSSMPEPDEVYYKFGGAAVADMLWKRYRSIHSCSENNRGTIIVEISVLKGVECSNKSIIPPSLQYRDNGFMYCPDEALIPFIKVVDDKVKVINKKGVQEHGGNIVQVTIESYSRHIIQD